MKRSIAMIVAVTLSVTGYAANEVIKRDANSTTVSAGVTSDDKDIRNLRTTEGGELKVDASGTTTTNALLQDIKDRAVTLDGNVGTIKDRAVTTDVNVGLIKDRAVTIDAVIQAIATTVNALTDGKGSIRTNGRVSVGDDLSTEGIKPVIVGGADTSGKARNMLMNDEGTISVGDTGLNTGYDQDPTQTVGLVDENGNGAALLTRPTVFDGTSFQPAMGNTLGAYCQGAFAHGEDASEVHPVIIGGVIYDGTAQEIAVSTGGGIVNQSTPASALVEPQANTLNGVGINDDDGGPAYPLVRPEVFDGTSWWMSRGNRGGTYVQVRVEGYHNTGVVYTTQQTGTLIWDPVVSGAHILLMGAYISSGDAGTEVSINGSTGSVAIPTSYFSESGGTSIPSGMSPLWIGAANENLTVTTNGAKKASVKLWGYEE